MGRPDLLILTAASEFQAKGYEEELARRRAHGAIAPDLRTLVVPDPGGRRIGSGASTFLALHAAATAQGRTRSRGGLEASFRGRNVLIVHSGGDSRRLPAYAALGKVFVPLPIRRGRTTGCLLDLILDDLAALFDSPKGRVVVAAGDLVVGVRGQRIRDDADVVGVAVPKPLRTGAWHGVFVTDQSGRWLDFLQKPKTSEMRERGAVDGGQVLVDSGVVSLSPRAAAGWLGAVGAAGMDRGQRSTGLLRSIQSGCAPALDLYVHLLGAFAERLDERAYLAACGLDETMHEALLELRSALRVLSARVAVLPDADFLHLGTTREYMEALISPRNDRRFGFFRRSDVLMGLSVERCSARGPRKAPDVVIDGCAVGVGVGRGPRPAGRNVIVGPPAGVSRWRLLSGWCAALLPVGARDWAMLLHHLDDDFKTSIAQGGTLGGRALQRWRHLLAATGADPDTSLFDLAIWPVGDVDEVQRRAAWLVGGPSVHPPRAWRASHRMSLREVVRRVDRLRWMELREVSAREHGRSMLRASLTLVGPEHTPRLEDALALATTQVEAASMVEDLLDLIRSRETPATARRAARAVQIAHALLRRFPRLARGRRALMIEDPRAKALSCVGESVRLATAMATKRASRRDQASHEAVEAGSLRRGRAVRVRAPVRIDLAGGWTDTSPISEEQGGCVVNMAVTLDGEAPVEVAARVIQEPVIDLFSVDADERVVFRGAGDLHGHGDPRDWAALGKAALVLCGYVPRRASASLAQHLRRLGGGVEIVMRSGVPRGSGLGTSSILAATLLAALDALQGRRVARSALVRRTSLVEQMISTRGGWQDQIGGVVPGIKISRTRAGDATGGAAGAGLPRARRLEMPATTAAELAARSILLFTGIRRMARGILENVVWRYLAGEPAVIDAIPRLKAGAEAMAEAVERGDIHAMAGCFGDYWRLKRVMDPGASTEAIESLIAPCASRLAGWGLTGAGGGGFAFLIARSAADAARVRRHFAAKAASGVQVFDFAIDTGGMRVDVGENTTRR